MWRRMMSICDGHGDRAELAARLGGELLGLVGQLAEEVVVDPLVDVDPLDAGAGLAGVGGGAPDRRVGGGVEVGVLVDDQRVLAAGLHQHRRERLGARGHHPPRGGRSTR